MRRGILPTLLATCQGDQIIQAGRLEEMYVPEFIVWDFLARGVNYSPIAPLQAQGTKGVGTLTLTLALPASQPFANIAGLVVTVGTNANVTPGNVYFTLSGKFEDGTVYTQDVQVKQARAGSSDFIILFSKEIQGGAYPALAHLVYDASAPTVLTIAVTNAATNTEVSVATLSPVSDQYYWMLAYWETSAQMARKGG